MIRICAHASKKFWNHNLASGDRILINQKAMDTNLRNAALSSKRLESLDVLRGFDMFLIIGGTGLIGSFIRATEWESMEWVTAQVRRAPRHGTAIGDVMFPRMLC